MSTAARRLLNDLRKKAGMTLGELSATSGVPPHRLIAVLYRPQLAKPGELDRVREAVGRRLNGNGAGAGDGGAGGIGAGGDARLLLPDYCHVLEAVRKVLGMEMDEVCNGKGRGVWHAAARRLMGEMLRRNRHLSTRRMARLMGVTAGAFRRRDGDGGWVEEAVREVERVLGGLMRKETRE